MDMEYEYLDEICVCGEKKKTQDIMCNKCQKVTIDTFKSFMAGNFDREQLEYLNWVLEGEYLPDYIFGKEERVE